MLSPPFFAPPDQVPHVCMHAHYGNLLRQLRARDLRRLWTFSAVTWHTRGVLVGQGRVQAIYLRHANVGVTKVFLGRKPKGSSSMTGDAARISRSARLGIVRTCNIRLRFDLVLLRDLMLFTPRGRRTCPTGAVRASQLTSDRLNPGHAHARFQFRHAHWTVEGARKRAIRCIPAKLAWISFK
jgi:hypothetical protein